MSDLVPSDWREHGEDVIVQDGPELSRYPGHEADRTLVHREVQGRRRLARVQWEDEFFADARVVRELAPDRVGWRWDRLAVYVFALVLAVVVLVILVAAGVVELSLPAPPWKL
jgi:hypothetical protein